MRGCDLTADPPDVASLQTAVAQVLRGLSDPGWIAETDPRLVQQLLSAAVALYAAKVERVGRLAPFDDRGELPVPTASEVCLATTQMLEAVSVEIFELALWKSWAGGALAPRTEDPKAASEEAHEHGPGDD